MNFVVFGLQPWDIEIGSNCKDIALELAKDHKVLYVNAPLSRNHYLFSRDEEKVKRRISLRKKKELAIEEVSENLWVYYPDCIVESLNFIRPHFLFSVLNFINNRRLARSISKAIKALEFEDFLLFNDNSIYLGYKLKELLKPEKYIYYIRDHLTKMDFWSYHGSRMEPDLISRADLIVTNSDYYKDYALKFNPNSFMIGQGCDFSLLNNFEKKEEFSRIAGPKIGYVGFLTTKRLSIELISSIATSKPEWNIVLVGPEDEHFKQSSLHEQDNVYFLGPKKPVELGSYINEFDVCINPQVSNEITIGNYPRKIDEYLYVGKPTVATYTKTMEYFSDFVSLAEDETQFIAAIEGELKCKDDDIVAQRKEFASTHTWQNSVEILLTKLKETPSGTHE